MPRSFPPVSKPDVSFMVLEFEPLLNSEQAAQLLQVHSKTLQKLARRGEIPAKHIGKSWRFRVSDLNRLVRGQPALKLMEMNKTVHPCSGGAGLNTNVTAETVRLLQPWRRIWEP